MSQKWKVSLCSRCATLAVCDRASFNKDPGNETRFRMSKIKEHISPTSSGAKLHQLLCFLLLNSLLSLIAHGQVLYGSLTGTVTDASGAVVSGAGVTALEVRTGVTQ